MAYGKVEICGINTAKLKTLRESEKIELLKKVQEGDMKARETLICGNLRLVLSVIQRFVNRGENLDDLFQIGCIGLMKAIDHFDISQDVRFSTYAVPVILGEIKKLFRDGGTVKVSRSIKELGLKVTAERERLMKLTGAEPTVAQLAQNLGATPEQVAVSIQAAMPVVSLTPADDEDGTREWDIPVDSPEEVLAERISLAEILKRLNESDRQLIRLRFYAGKTQSKTAQILGTTQVQISRRERKILKWMRKELTSE